jgi:hypothetical protein
VKEKVDDLLERGVFRQVADIVSDVDEFALLAVDVAKLGLGGDDVLQTSLKRIFF